ncbi:MAG: hypothetical protein FWC47_03370 [Oscillospiraceae bacterium]|nr:hypothetical protein [Oscillospiraceae bacterium]
MKYLMVSSETGNQITFLGLKDYRTYGKFNLNGFGPTKALRWKNSIIAISKQRGELSFVNRQIDKFKTYYIGPYLTDFLIVDSKSFLLSGDSNKLIIFDNNQREIEYMLETANLPLNIDYMQDEIMVTNYESKEIEIFSLTSREKKLSIKNEKHPFKSMFIENGRYIMSIEGFEQYEQGTIYIYDSKNGNKLENYKTCNAPVDFYYKDGLCYVCDYFSDSLWEINLTNKESRKIPINNFTPNNIAGFEGKLLICSEKYNKIIEIHGSEIKSINVPSPRRIDLF